MKLSPFLKCIVAIGCIARIAWAQGGPPFRSDDPDTPGKNHWEVNTVVVGDRNPLQGSYEVPNIDINYGLGNRIQLKYEVPLAVQEVRGPSGSVNAGLGNSLLGVKWRFYAHHPKSEATGEVDKKESTFGLSTYPQLLLSNPTSSVRRDVVEPGPQFLLPVEMNAKIGPIRVSGELGYWFTNKQVPNVWIRGVIVGHEFSKRNEVYLEVYDEASTAATPLEQKFRESTAGLGFRSAISPNRALWFVGMAGRSIAVVTATNGQPTWIASFGFQFLSANRRRNSSDADQ